MNDDHTTAEFRGGHDDIGPHPLRPWTDEHQSRDFDLATIVVFVEVRNLVNLMESGADFSIEKDPTLAKAYQAGNEMSVAKGYLPLFSLKDGRVVFADDADEAVASLWDSEVWKDISSRHQPRLIKQQLN